MAVTVCVVFLGVLTLCVDAGWLEKCVGDIDRVALGRIGGAERGLVDSNSDADCGSFVHSNCFDDCIPLDSGVIHGGLVVDDQCEAEAVRGNH